MEILKGTFGSLHNFLAWIALPNCEAYFHRDEERDDSLYRERSRLLFNAVVALDSAVDYSFSEAASGRSDEFMAELLGTHPELGELRELANAMKHAIRGRDTKQGFRVWEDKLHAAKLVTPRLSAEIDISNPASPKVVNLDLTADLVDRADEILGAAFRHWFDLFQKF